MCCIRIANQYLLENGYRETSFFTIRMDPQGMADIIRKTPFAGYHMEQDLYYGTIPTIFLSYPSHQTLRPGNTKASGRSSRIMILP